MNQIEQVNEKAVVAKEDQPKVARSIRGYKLELTEDEANFLDGKGPTFADLWARRLKNGMKPVLRARFDEMVAEFVNSGGNITSATVIPKLDRILSNDEN